MPTGPSPRAGGPDMIRGMTTDLWLDYLGVRLDSRKAKDTSFVINIIIV